jgi:hypothetical protein
VVHGIQQPRPNAPEVNAAARMRQTYATWRWYSERLFIR